MKKITLLLLLSTLIITFASCGEDTSLTASLSSDSPSLVEESSTAIMLVPNEEFDAPVDALNEEESILLVSLTDLQGMLENYVFPLAYSTGATNSWSNAHEITADNWVKMYGYANVWNTEFTEQELESGWHEEDASVVEEYIQQYVNVDVEYLRTSDFYDDVEQTYRFSTSEEVFSLDLHVLRAEFNPSIYELTLYLDNGLGGENSSGEATRLNIEIFDDKSFQYLNNEVLEEN